MELAGQLQHQSLDTEQKKSFQKLIQFDVFKTQS